MSIQVVCLIDRAEWQLKPVVALLVYLIAVPLVPPMVLARLLFLFHSLLPLLEQQTGSAWPFPFPFPSVLVCGGRLYLRHYYESSHVHVDISINAKQSATSRGHRWGAPSPIIYGGGEATPAVPSI